MRRRLTILAMMLAVLLVLVTSDTTQRTAIAQQKITCSQAFQACNAQHQAEHQSCVILGGVWSECFCRATRIFNSCMIAHGCPSGTVDLEAAGCPDS